MGDMRELVQEIGRQLRPPSLGLEHDDDDQEGQGGEQAQGAAEEGGHEGGRMRSASEPLQPLSNLAQRYGDPAAGPGGGGGGGGGSLGPAAGGLGAENPLTSITASMEHVTQDLRLILPQLLARLEEDANVVARNGRQACAVHGVLLSSIISASLHRIRAEPRSHSSSSRSMYQKW